jgi:oligopeptide transport system permease protein
VTRFILRRLVELVPTALVIVAASFALVRLAPGSPFSSEREIPPEVLRELDAKYGFDRPLPEQFARYLGNLLRGDLGLSTKYPQRSVNEIIADGFPVTLSLAAVALVWALLVGITAGVIGAVRQNTVWDHGAMTAALVGISIPSFVLGPAGVTGGTSFFPGSRSARSTPRASPGSPAAACSRWCGATLSAPPGPRGSRSGW